jgi:endonuclease/exonuclease/phosphatase family metal-dependent hydrolase
MRRIASLPIWVIGLLTLGCIVAIRIPEPQNGLLIFAASMLPWLFVLSIPLFGLAILLRSRALSALLGVCVITFSVLFAPLFLPRIDQPDEGVAVLKVLSYNLWAVRRSVDANAVAKLIRDEQPDVVALQEVDAKALFDLRLALQQLDPTTDWRLAADVEIGQAILSRHPITITNIEKQHTRLLQAQIETSAGPIAIWNVHALRPAFQGELSFLAYNEDNPRQSQTIGQLDWLLEQISRVDEPLILLGDFNFPALSPDHQRLTRVLHDAHWESGWGFGFTFPASDGHARRVRILGRTVKIASPIRLIKIDHILHSPHFAARWARILDNRARSDHAPIAAELLLYSR